MARGGKRDGAGRPPSEEAKKMMRVPASAVVEIRESISIVHSRRQAGDRNATRFRLRESLSNQEPCRERQSH